MEVIFLLMLFSFFLTFLTLPFFIKKLNQAKIVGLDVNKKDRPAVAEMGGLAIISSFLGSIFLLIVLVLFFNYKFNLWHIIAASLSALAVAFIGIVDDLIDIRQILKALLPLFCAIPLMLIVTDTTLNFPIIGKIDFGIFYIVLLVPLGLAVASNLTNMLAGFNGLEAGLGIIIFSFMLIISILSNNLESAALFSIILGSLVAFLYYNFYPAKVFMGDCATLLIGAILAAGTIIGKLEVIGALALILYVIDFFIKAFNKFPTKDWWGEYKDGKLFSSKPKTLATYIMKFTNGIKETNLVFLLWILQIIICLILLIAYLGGIL